MDQLKPWQKQKPVYPCVNCAEDYSWPKEDLRIYQDNLWCDECFNAHCNDADESGAWYDLPKFEPYITAADIPEYLIQQIRAETLEEMSTKRREDGHGLFPNVWRKRLRAEADKIREGL